MPTRDQVPTSNTSVLEWIKARVAGDDQMRAAASARDAEPGGIVDPDEDHDALVVLTRDHNQVRALQEQLETLPSHRTGGSAAQLERRKSIVDMITVRLSGHESVEKEYFWPTVRDVLDDGDERADDGIAQEQEGKDTLTALGTLAPDTEEFDELVEQLVLLLRKHVAYEEKVFLDLRTAMSDEARTQLGEQMLRAGKAPPVDGAPDKAGDRPAERRGKAGRHAAGKRPDDRPEGDGR